MAIAKAISLSDKFVSGLTAAIKEIFAGAGFEVSLSIPHDKEPNVLCRLYKSDNTNAVFEIAVFPAPSGAVEGDGKTALFSVYHRNTPALQEKIAAQALCTVLEFLVVYEKKAGQQGLAQLRLALQLYHRNPGVGGKARSLQQRIVIIEKCNQRCPFCAVGKGVLAPSRKEVLSQVKELASMGCRHVCVTGGEPTLHKELVPLLKAMRKAGMESMEIQTNGIKFADKKFLAQTLDSGVNAVVFSFHAHTEAAYNRITGTKNQFAKAKQGFANLLAMAQERKLRCLVMIVLNKYNFSRLPAHIKFLADLAGGPEKLSVSLSQMNDCGCISAPGFMADFAGMRPFVREAEKYCRQQGVTLVPMSGSPCVPPLCLFSDPAAIVGERPAPYAVGDVVYADKLLKSGNFRAKRVACKKCPLDAFCPGVPSQYAKKFGLAALKPVSGGKA